MSNGKPIGIFRHCSSDGPGHFQTFLDLRNISWKLICIDAGDPVPLNAGDYSGLVFMGGPMSVNDDLPWIKPTIDLIRSAVDSNIPVMGHCLGGQLLSRALGGKVSANPCREIGWHEISIADNDTARHWFGHVGKSFLSFHWHQETFDIPSGATALMSSLHCRNQAFALGPHLGMQCHIEMTAEMVQEWCESGAADLVSNEPNIQCLEHIGYQLDTRIADLHSVADGVYSQWIKNISNE